MVSIACRAVSCIVCIHQITLIIVTASTASTAYALIKIKVNSCDVTSYIAVYHERDAKGCISIEREDVVLKSTRAIPEIIKKFIEDM